MEEEAGKVFVPKTQAQLQKDLFWVNLQQIGEGPLFTPPKETIDNSSDFKKKIDVLRPYARYDEYVQALRRLRREQGGSIQEYMNAGGFAPHLARKVLENINHVPTWSDEKTVFTNSEFNRAVKSEKDFLEVLNVGLDRQPKAFYRGIDYIKYLLPLERIKKVIDRADAEGGNINYGFIYNFDSLKALFNPDEQRIHINAELKMGHNTTFALNLFRDPEIRKMYNPQVVHSIVIQNFKDSKAGINPRIAKSYLHNGIITRDELTQIALHHVEKLGSIGNFSLQILPLLPNNQSRQEVKAIILDAYTNRANAENSRWLSSMTDMFTPDEIYQMVSSIALRNKSGALVHIDSYEWMVSPEKFAPILRDILASPELQIDGYAAECVLLSKSITEEEKEKFVDQLISMDRESLILDRDGKGFFGFQDDKRRDRVARKVLLKCNVRQVAKTYSPLGGEGWRRDVSDEVLMEVIGIAKFSEANAWISQLRNWGEDLFQFHPDYILGFLEKHRETSAEDLFVRLKTVVKYLPEDSKPQFIQDLIRSNPIIALADTTEASEKGNDGLLSQADISITPEQIMQLLQDDQEHLSFAPKTFKEFIKKYNPQVTPEEQKTLLIETSHVYKSIAFIKALGLETEFRKIQSKGELSSSREKELLSTFYCFALLKDRNPQDFLNLSNFGESLEEAKIVLFNKLYLIFELDKQLNQEEIDRFFGAMQSPVPFTMYLLQYEKSESHKRLLKHIFESITQGKFSEWKYGLPTQESLDQLKTAGLLPESLSLQQYLDWQVDGQVSLVDSLATDTKTTANAVASYMEGNIDHLHIGNFMEDLIRQPLGQDPLVMVQAEIAALGQKLAFTNKELTYLIKSSGDIDKITRLKEEKQKLEGERKELIRARKILRLITIKPNEVALGYFLEDKDGKHRGDSLNDVLSELEENAFEEDKFVYGAVRDMINLSKSTTSEKQNLTCTDSSDPKVWLEIGENPVASCQSYIDGGHNDCLVAYTDPNTKILVLHNERGHIIARSIFRLLITNNGNPALHVERIYSTSTSKSVAKIIYARAYQKAREMDLSLLISEQSQDEDGAEKEFQKSEEYQATKVDYSLISKSSRAPKVYVDSAGGVARGGAYEMTDLLEIKK